MAQTDAVLSDPTEFDALSIPPWDSIFLSSSEDHNQLNDLDFNLDESFDFDFNFDDLDAFELPSCDNFNATQSIDDDQVGVVSADVAADEQSFDLDQLSAVGGGGGGEGPVSSHSSVPANYSNSNSPDSVSQGNYVVEQKIEVDEIAKVSSSSVPKRKKGNEDVIRDARKSKCRRPDNGNVVANSEINEVDGKRKERLIRNRESAQLSRQRRKHYVEELEEKVKVMNSTIAELNGKVSYLMAENATLRQQLMGASSNGVAAPMMYPQPMGYPWAPYAPYMVKQQGSKTVPLVPIPRLKPRNSELAPKVKKRESKTKKVASITFIGLLFFILLFGGLAPIVNMKFGGMRDEVSDMGVYDQHRGRVLTVNDVSNGSHESKGSDFTDGGFDIGINSGGLCQKEVKPNRLTGSNEFVHVRNGSEPLVASLYVPRNDKLVKIDGNLIIHSILASEKARASQQKENSSETGLAIPKDLYTALGNHPSINKNSNERPKALPAGNSDKLKDHSKLPAADGKVQQWFREGLAGPLLSSGMCTEVFHFDVSSASALGGMVPASSFTNTSRHHENSTRLTKRGRRLLRGLPASLPVRSNVNFTGGKTSQRNSSVIVSVLVDPREAAENDMITPKSLSRIFVVVLLDSVKYITYSCMLPRAGNHLVTT
ncbi:hypothetical protein ACFE04_029765 [Oxalis oulophora]